MVVWRLELPTIELANSKHLRRRHIRLQQPCPNNLEKEIGVEGRRWEKLSAKAREP
jgi:hypothetical protein